MKLSSYPLVTLPGEDYPVPGREGLRLARQAIRRALRRDVQDLDVYIRGKDTWAAYIWFHGGRPCEELRIERRMRAVFEGGASS